MTLDMLKKMLIGTPCIGFHFYPLKPMSSKKKKSGGSNPVPMKISTLKLFEGTSQTINVEITNPRLTYFGMSNDTNMTTGEIKYGKRKIGLVCNKKQTEWDTQNNNQTNTQLFQVMSLLQKYIGGKIIKRTNYPMSGEDPWISRPLELAMKDSETLINYNVMYPILKYSYKKGTSELQCDANGEPYPPNVTLKIDVLESLKKDMIRQNIKEHETGKIQQLERSRQHNGWNKCRFYKYDEIEDVHVESSIEEIEELYPKSIGTRHRLNVQSIVFQISYVYCTGQKLGLTMKVKRLSVRMPKKEAPQLFAESEITMSRAEYEKKSHEEEEEEEEEGQEGQEGQQRIGRPTKSPQHIRDQDLYE